MNTRNTIITRISNDFNPANFAQLDTVANLPANDHANIRAQLCNLNQLNNANRLGVLDGEINVLTDLDAEAVRKHVKGCRDYQQLIGNPIVQTMPTLAAILQVPQVKDHLITSWGALAGNPNVDVNALYNALAAVNTQVGADFQNAFDGVFNVVGLPVILQNHANLTDGHASLNTLRGEARFQAFTSREAVKTNTVLLRVLNTPQVKKSLEDYWETRNPPGNIDGLWNAFADDRPHAQTGQAYRNAFITVFENAPGGNVPGLNDALRDHAHIDAANLVVGELRGEGRFQVFIAREDIKNNTKLLEVLNTREVKELLIQHWSPSNQAPPANISGFLSTLADPNTLSSQNFRDAFIAVFGNIAGLDNALRINANIADAHLNLPRLRGEARYQKFMADNQAELDKLQALKGILSNGNVQTALKNYWGDVNNPFPPNLTALRNELANAADVAAAKTAIDKAVFNDNARFGGVNVVPDLDRHLIGAGLAAGGSENQLRGEARYQKFMADNNSYLMPELKRILSDDAVKTPLENRWATAGNPVPDQAGLNTLRDNLAVAADAAGARAAIDHAMSGDPHVTVPALDVALGTAGLLHANNDENKLRGEARYQKFMADNDAELIKTPALKNILSNAVVRGALETHWKANLAPAAVDFVELRKNLANARSAENARAIITTAMADAGGNAIPNLNRDLGTAGILQNDNDVKKLRGEARVFAFLNDPLVQSMGVIQTVFNAHDSAVKNAFITHLGDHARTAPNAAVLRDALASSDDNAGLREIFSSRRPDGLFGIDLPVNTDQTLRDGEDRGDTLRGQARYQKFMADNKAAFDDIPELKRIFIDRNVQTLLEDYWGVAGNPFPPVITALRDKLANTAAVGGVVNAADARTAINNAMFGGAGGIPGLDAELARLLPDGHENQLRGEVRYQKFMTDNKVLLDTMPVLRDHFKRNKIKNDLITHYRDHANPLPDNTHLEALRKNLMTSANEGEAIGFIHDAMKAGGGVDVRNLVRHLGVPIDNINAMQLRNEATTSQHAADEVIRKEHCKDLHEKISKYKKARDNFKLADPRTKPALENAAQELLNILPTEHELRIPLTKLKANLVAGDSEKIRVSLSDTQIKYDKLKKGAGSLVNDNIKKSIFSDNKNFDKNLESGIYAYRLMAQKYKDEAYRRARSISPEDAAELKSIKKSCNTLMNTIDLAEGELLEKKASLENTNKFVLNRSSNLNDVNKRLKNIGKCRRYLNEANAEIDKAQRKGSVDELNCYSTAHKIIDATTSEADIRSTIQELYRDNGGGGPLGAGGGFMVVRDDSFSERFGADKLRVNYNTLQKKDGDNISFASLQGNIEGKYTSKFYYDYDEVVNLPSDELVKAAARSVEDFLTGMENKKEKMSLKGNMHPKLAEAICIYCSIKGYPRPYSSIKLPARSKAELERYKDKFAGILVDKNKEIFVGRGTIGIAAEKVKELQAATQSEPEASPSTIKPRF